MTKQSIALQMAINALTNCSGFEETIQACKEALAETQEPIGRYFSDQNHFTILGLERDKVKSGDLLYTTPPSREWVGLSDEEISELWYNIGSSSYDFAKAIEAKLREKNT